MKPCIRNTLLAVVLIFSCTHVFAQSERLGEVNFPVSCNPEAQKLFQRAAALYHSFDWPRVTKAFQAVLEADPQCAMAWWGIALATQDNPFVWPISAKQVEDGWAAIEKAKAIGAKTQRERDYIAALELFYKDGNTVPHRERALAYEEAMEKIAKAYSDDIEAQVLYALALSANFEPTDKKYTKQLKAAKILEPVFKKYPHHPGAAHYLIHSYDYPAIAAKGLDAARRYAAIAPSAPHALHMPSHIFTRVGYWKDSVESNRASFNSTKDLRTRLHALDYMTYAYLQMGQDTEARRGLDEVLKIEKVPGENFVAAYALAAIPARLTLERNRWAEAAVIKPHPSDAVFKWNNFPNAAAVTAFARGLGAARSGNVAAAKEELERLNTRVKPAMIAAKQTYWADQADIQIKIIESWIAKAEGDHARALQLARAAAKHEDSTEKHVVTPGPILPARELLGDLLMELGQPDAALKEYEASIAKEPNRFRGLYSAGRAAEAAGNMAKARAWYDKLAQVAAQADADVAQVQHAKTFLARQ
jgi:tetratricopeptide (TPR) repeat protein